MSSWNPGGDEPTSWHQPTPPPLALTSDRTRFVKFLQENDAIELQRAAEPPVVAPGSSKLRHTWAAFLWFASGEKKHTLQGISISHLGKRKIIFKMPVLGDMLVPWRVIPTNLLLSPLRSWCFRNPYRVPNHRKWMVIKLPSVYHGIILYRKLNWWNLAGFLVAINSKTPNFLPSLITKKIHPRKTNGWKKTKVMGAFRMNLRFQCTLGPQKPWTWTFYTPKIWIITPKNEGCGFPWYGVISGWNNFSSFGFAGRSITWPLWSSNSGFGELKHRKILYWTHGVFVFQKLKDPLKCLRHEYWKRKQLVLGHVSLWQIHTILKICIYTRCIPKM